MNAYQKYLKQKPPPKKKFHGPQGWLMMIAFILTAGIAGFFFSDDQAVRFLNRVEVSILGEAVAESKEKPKTQDKAEAAAEKAKGQEKKSSEADKTQASAEAQPKSWTPEEIALFTKLEGRKKELDARETELNKLEEELHKQKEDLEKRLAALQEVRQKIATRLEDRVKVDQQRVDTLVSVYANMKPVQAAKVLEGLHEELAVEVLAKMKNKSAAEILNLMDPEKAKKISERFAGLRDPALAGQ